MKAFIILVPLVIFLHVGCKQNTSVSNLEGTYVSQTNGEYAVNYDTLIVTSLHTAAKSYSIQLKTGFQKIRNGQKLEKAYKEASWTATWDESKHVLIESELGKQIQFRQGDDALLWNELVFKKI